MNENICIFTPDTMTLNGIDFPASYSVQPSSNPNADGSVYVFVTSPDDQKIRIRIAPEDPRHAAALAAATGTSAQSSTVKPAAEPEPVPTEEPAAEPTPAKQAHGPVPEKDWIGTSIQGNGWKIEFCPIFEQTRLIFDRIPTKEARELVKAAGFAWSPKMGSWNKKLTWKAYRAAQKLAADLGNMSRRAC